MFRGHLRGWLSQGFLAAALLGHPVGLQWGYDVTLPLADYREYRLEQGDVLAQTWRPVEQFPMVQGTAVILERQTTLPTLPACVRLRASGVDAKTTPPGVVVSDPSNVVCAEAPPVDNTALPAPTMALAAVLPNAIDITMTWAPATAPALREVPLTASSITADSAHSSDYAARLAIDGDLATFWHTPYGTGTLPHPHWLLADLGKTWPVAGFTYQTRQDGLWNGTITLFALAVSSDKTTWSAPAEGVLAKTAARQTVRIPPTPARYVRLTSQGAVGTTPYAAAAELTILATQPPLPLADLKEYVVETQCPSCGAWQELIRFPALAQKVLVTKRRLQVRTPQCLRLALTGLDRSVTPPQTIMSPFTAPLCTTP